MNGGRGRSRAAAVDDGSAEESLARRRALWVDAVNAESLDGHASLLAEQVLWLRPGQLALHGRQQVLDWLAPFFEQFEYEFSVDQTALRVTDDWAVDRGVFSSRVRPKGAEPWDDHTGVYLMTWHRDPDDVWYVHQYVEVTGLFNIESGRQGA